MSDLALTNLYLESRQKKALAKKAKTNGTNMSVEVRSAVDAYLNGLNAEEFSLLDAATASAKRDIDEINQILTAGQKRAEKFFKQIDAIKAGAVK